MPKFIFRLWLLTALISLVAGCATVGQPYAEHKVSELVINTTSRAQVQSMFGNPWRVGSESGQQTWTYGHYRYSLFGNDQTSDLVVRFNQEGKVASYTYNRTTPNPESSTKGTAGP